MEEKRQGFRAQLLHEEHVLLVHGSGFSKDKGQGHIRLVFARYSNIAYRLRSY